MSADEPRDLDDPHDAIGGRPTRNRSALRWPRTPVQREDVDPLMRSWAARQRRGRPPVVSVVTLAILPLGPRP